MQNFGTYVDSGYGAYLTKLAAVDRTDAGGLEPDDIEGHLALERSELWRQEFYDIECRSQSYRQNGCFTDFYTQGVEKL